MNLTDMTVTQLREFAVELSISGRSKMSKADIIAAIEFEYAARDAEAGELLDAVLGSDHVAEVAEALAS